MKAHVVCFFLNITMSQSKKLRLFGLPGINVALQNPLKISCPVLQVFKTIVKLYGVIQFSLPTVSTILQSFSGFRVPSFREKSGPLIPMIQHILETSHEYRIGNQITHLVSTIKILLYQNAYFYEILSDIKCTLVIYKNSHIIHQTLTIICKLSFKYLNIY